MHSESIICVLDAFIAPCMTCGNGVILIRSSQGNYIP